VTRGSIRLAGTECATDRWVPLTGQRSTLTGPQLGFDGPGWAGFGLGWAGFGPGWAHHVADSGTATSHRWVPDGSSPCGRGSPWTVRCGFVNRRLGSWWTEFTCYLHLLVYGAPVARFRVAAKLSPFLCFLAALPCTPPSAWRSRAASPVALFPFLDAHDLSLAKANRSSSSPSSLLT
jgi:hypothetical protein